VRPGPGAVPGLERLPHLREIVRATAENRPGVYRMIDQNGGVLYVGKSVHIRTRLLSYFRAPEGEKARRILSRAHSVDWDYVPDPFAALLHEWRLIRRLRPPFNREHKRETSYRFIKLTAEPTPRLLVSRTVADDGASYWGPFGAGARVKHGVRVLSGIMGVRDCAASTPMSFADQADLFVDAGRRAVPLCTRGELRLCLAPCVGGCTTGVYADAVAETRAFLDGETYEPIHRLTARMQDAADRQRFELAARLRERVEALHRLLEALALARGALERLTFVYSLPAEDDVSTCYLIHRGHVMSTVRVRRGRAGGRDRAHLREQARLLWSRSAEKRRRVDARTAGELLVVAGWFRRKPEELERVTPVEELLGRRTA